MSERLFELFDDYAAAYARGERPSAEEYLAKAGADREQLASLLDEYVRRAPVHGPSEDDVRHLGLLLAEEPALLALRVQRGMRVDDVVGALVARLALEESMTAKVKRYYQRLEGGLLDPRGLSARLRSALSETLGEGAGEAVSWTAPPTAAPAFLRRADYVEAESAAAAPAAPAAEDEVDRLFTGGA